MIKDNNINKEISNYHTRMSIDDLEKILVADVEWQKNIIIYIDLTHSSYTANPFTVRRYFWRG